LGQAQTAPEPAQAATALMLKLVGGRHRGRSIATPDGDTTRPTSSRARESLFNILAHASWRDDGTSPLIDARVLDAFAGSGALGIEALSRGAAHVTFLDNDATAIRLIGENLRKLGETDNARVIRADALRPPPSREACDLVFLDPPYRSGQAAPALLALTAAGWLTPDAIATVELANTEDIVPPTGFAAIDERRYGLAKIVILRRMP
jgi:16S rRNA (guanine966-N2)-methyltransferase